MRRPTFARFCARAVKELTGHADVNVRRDIARAQRERNDELFAALMLYAISHERTEYALSRIWDPDYRSEAQDIITYFGLRDLERVALLNRFSGHVPPSYETVLSNFASAYHEVEARNDQKSEIQSQLKDLCLRYGISMSRIAQEISKDPSNVTAFVQRAEYGRLSYEDAARALDVVTSLTHE